MTRAVVFANSSVGARCLEVLLAARVEVPLVVTHRADPTEAAFANVEALARSRGLDVTMPDDASAPHLVEHVRQCAPDFIFSFYYRQLLDARILDCAPRGALNMHGSLLPKYRGRVPVNWAVIHGERETGATLHYMTTRPDAGDVVDQQAVPILPDDTAFEVFNKVVVAAEIVLWRMLPALVRGDAPRMKQDESAATYLGRRRPEDGRIDWTATAQSIHDLVRGVAPPYPGAFAMLKGHRARILKTRLDPRRAPEHPVPTLYVRGGDCLVDCAGGAVLRILETDLDGKLIDPRTLLDALGAGNALELPRTEAKALP